MNYKSFSKIKIYEFTINLARGKSLRTKRKKFQCLFQPVCGQERGQFDLSNLDIVGSYQGLSRAATVSLNVQIIVPKIRIDGRHSVPTFPKVNNSCIDRK